MTRALWRQQCRAANYPLDRGPASEHAARRVRATAQSNGVAAAIRFTTDDFRLDLVADRDLPGRAQRHPQPGQADGARTAQFKRACTRCPLCERHLRCRLRRDREPGLRDRGRHCLRRAVRPGAGLAWLSW